MWLESQVQPGSLLDITVTPPNGLVPPLAAQVEVLRCTPLEDGEGSFAVACQIRELLA